MMLSSELLTILRCPDDRSTLAAANDTVVDRVNEAIRDARLVNRAGNRIEQLIDGGLLRADGAFLYPIVDQIPVLLRDDAIPMDQLRE
jgi:uncharacterized protein YbaR (Trm112 family)